MKEVESIKGKEEELVKCLPQLQEVEEEYKSKTRKFEELTSILAGTCDAFSN